MKLEIITYPHRRFNVKSLFVDNIFLLQMDKWKILYIRNLQKNLQIIIFSLTFYKIVIEINIEIKFFLNYFMRWEGAILIVKLINLLMSLTLIKRLNISIRSRISI